MLPKVEPDSCYFMCSSQNGQVIFFLFAKLRFNLIESNHIKNEILQLNSNQVSSLSEFVLGTNRHGFRQLVSRHIEPAFLGVCSSSTISHVFSKFFSP